MAKIPQTLTLTIPGRPVPAKNNPVMVAGRNLILPSKAFRAYKTFCIGTKKRPGWLCQWGNVQFVGPVRVDCHYWLPSYQWWPDLVGLLQGTSDILQAAGIIVNDKNIVTYGTSAIVGIDRDNPRVEITISDAPKPRWWKD